MRHPKASPRLLNPSRQSLLRGPGCCRLMVIAKTGGGRRGGGDVNRQVGDEGMDSSCLPTSPCSARRVTSRQHFASCAAPVRSLCLRVLRSAADPPPHRQMRFSPRWMEEWSTASVCPSASPASSDLPLSPPALFLPPSFLRCSLPPRFSRRPQ